MSANVRRYFTPWALSLPGTVLFVSLLLIPMLMTVVLSFNVYDADLGAVPDKYTIAHYLKVLGDSYYYEIFFRTYWISLCVALICVIIGVTEAYIHPVTGATVRSTHIPASLTAPASSPTGPAAPAAPTPVPAGRSSATPVIHSSFYFNGKQP